MANINEILARAESLRKETALNSIDPERAGGIMYDTLVAMNELWLQQGAALVISKIYASVAAMEADTEPVSDLTGKPLRPGQIVVIASSDSDNGSVYRYNGAESPSWTLVGSIGNLEPVDSLDSDSTSLPLAAHQGKVLDDKISQLGQEIQDISLRDSAFDCGLNLNIFESGFIDCTQNPVTFNRNDSSVWRSAVIAVKSGETYNVKCYSTSSAAYGIALFDKNRDILSHQDGNDTTVSVAIEQDGFLVVNHGRAATIPTIIRVKIYSLEEKRNTLKDWILSESFSLRGDATYTDGVISSPISVSYPDESYGEISVTRNSDGDITSLSATNVQLGIRLNMSIERYADGSVKSQNISFETL